MKKLAVLLFVVLCITGCSSVKKNGSVTKSNVKETETTKNSKSKVIVNLFHWTGCSHCKEEKEWLEEMEKNYDYLTVNYYEVTQYEKFVTKVREKLEIDGDYVPLTVIGDDYLVGYSGSIKNKINKLIDKYHDKEYCDIVSYIKNDSDIDECHSINEQLN